VLYILYFGKESHCLLWSDEVLLGQFGPSFLSPHSLYSLIHSISLVPDMDPDPYERAWLIGLSHGDSVDDLQRNISRDPIFDRESLRPWNGYGAADPFAIFVRDRWYLFFELLVRNEGNAVIAVASSYDLKQWQVLGIALKESHHLRIRSCLSMVVKYT
jgi:hypothetical protein